MIFFICNVSRRFHCFTLRSLNVCILTMFNKKTFRLANMQLYEECQIDDQCSGTSGKSVCREVLRRKLCLCDKGYVEDKESLKCRKGKTL